MQGNASMSGGGGPQFGGGGGGGPSFGGGAIGGGNGAGGMGGAGGGRMEGYGDKTKKVYLPGYLSGPTRVRSLSSN